jgi:succinate dehydrogenase hydrophobic anchor subunit
MAVTTPTLPGAREQPHPAATRPAATARDWSWLLQAVTGVAVLGLVTLHMVANHFIVPGGLRSYEQVVEWLSSPIVVALEVTFLAVVTWHALLGVRSVLFDLGLSLRAERWITRGLTLVGLLVVGYGLWLTGVIAGQA